MNRDAFLRVALVAAVTLYVVGLAAVDQVFGPWWCAAAAVFGVAGAFAATVVFEHEPGDEQPRRRLRQPRDGTRGFERIT